MGLFSRKDRTPKASSIRGPRSPPSSPAARWRPGRRPQVPRSDRPHHPNHLEPHIRRHGQHQAGTPLTPFSPAHNVTSIPKFDLPRAPDPQLDPRGLPPQPDIGEERFRIVTDKALQNELQHFDVDVRKFADVVTFVGNIIKVRRVRTTDVAFCRNWPAGGFSGLSIELATKSSLRISSPLSPPLSFSFFSSFLFLLFFFFFFLLFSFF